MTRFCGEPHDRPVRLGRRRTSTLTRINVLAVVWVAVMTLAACAGPALPPVATPSGEPAAIGNGLPMCDEVPRISAPADWYRDAPIYVANEMPVLEVRDWAQGQPGYQDIWIDRTHAGWITVAFSEGAEQRQAELGREFPGVGVVAVDYPRSTAELEALQRRAIEALAGIVEASGTYVDRGVVYLSIGPLTRDRIAAVEASFAGQPICLEGVDPALVPPEGPQPLEGDGWVLLADAKGAGQPYRTGIAYDEASYEELWRMIGLEDERPPVDFVSEVVIWFGAVFSGSCPDIRLDDVVVDRERSIVHAHIVALDAFGACTADANPHAYVVALQRSRLPAGPFAIQLGAEDPPAGVPEERTVVNADLSKPGAVALPGQIAGDPALPEPQVEEPGTIVETGYPFDYRQWVHCGLEWLGPINGVMWRTETPDGAIDWVPEEWEPLVREEQLTMTIIIRLEPETHLRASANGHTVVYQPAAEPGPGCD